jgi:hypothetical protein
MSPSSLASAVHVVQQLLDAGFTRFVHGQHGFTKQALRVEMPLLRLAGAVWNRRLAMRWQS